MPSRHGMSEGGGLPSFIPQKQTGQYDVPYSQGRKHRTFSGSGTLTTRIENENVWLRSGKRDFYDTVWYNFICV